MTQKGVETIMKITNILMTVACALTYSITFSSCGHDDKVKGYEAARKMGVHRVMPDLRQGGIDEAFIPYVEIFESYYGGAIGDITINFVPSLEKAARCRRDMDARRSIVVREDSWESLRDLGGDDSELSDGREFLLAHELGHCVLNKAHSSSGIMMGLFTNGDIRKFTKEKERMYYNLFN